jgi:hypothetical protein
MSRKEWVVPGMGLVARVGMLRLRGEDRFALLSASLSMTGFESSGGVGMLRLRNEDRFTILIAPLSMTTRKGVLSMTEGTLYVDRLRLDFAIK